MPACTYQFQHSVYVARFVTFDISYGSFIFEDLLHYKGRIEHFLSVFALLNFITVFSTVDHVCAHAAQCNMYVHMHTPNV